MRATQMDPRRQLAALCVLVAGFAACGEYDDGETELKQSAVQSFGSWVTIPGGVLLDAPALVQSSGGTLVAFGLGTDSQIWTNAQNASGQWGGWNQLSNNGPAFTSRPAAVSLFLTGIVPAFALVARRSDNQYYFRIQNQTGAIIMDWTAIPVGTFSSAPALAFAGNSLVAPKNTFVLVGLGLDGHVREARNALVLGAIYSHSAWTNRGAIFSTTFTRAPAVTFACPKATTQSSLFVAAGFDATAILISEFNGSSWSAWRRPSAFAAASGPALATGCTGSTRDITLYARGLDNRISVSNELSGGAGWRTFTGTFAGNPSAAGLGGFAHVAAIDASGIPFTNKALSP